MRYLTNRKKIWIFFVASLIVLILAQIVLDISLKRGLWGIGELGKYILFNSPQFEFTIEYPKGWVAADLPEGNHGDRDVIALISYPGFANPYLEISRIASFDGSLLNLANWGESRMRAGKRKIEEETDLKQISTIHYNGLEREYMFTSSSFLPISRTRRCKDDYLLFQNTGFVITFCSYEKDWSQLESVHQHMINSFVIIEKAK